MTNPRRSRGASGIVIGTRRWDTSAGHWVLSPSTRLPQPLPLWGTPVTNAHVLSRTRDAVAISLLNPKIPAWFVVRFDPRTLRPRVLDMTATAHFMHHVYSGYNAARRIVSMCTITGAFGSSSSSVSGTSRERSYLGSGAP